MPSFMNQTRIFGTIAQVFLLAGCTTISDLPLVEKVEKTIGQLPLVKEVENRLHHFTPPVQLPSRVDPEKFASCMAPLSAKLQTGFTGLIGILKNDATNQLLLGQMSELEAGNLLDNELSLHSHIDHLFNKLVNDIKIDEAANPGGGLIGKRITEIAKLTATDTSHFKENNIAVALRTEIYLKAYFKKGVAQLDDTEIAKLQTKLAATLKLDTDNPAIDKVFKLFDLQLKKLPGELLHNAPGFIGRDGTQYGFPGVVADNKNVTIDHSQIGADSLRIILEAIRDTYAPLPAIAGSTATNPADPVDYQEIYPVDRLDFTDDPKSTIAGDWHLDHHDASKILHVKISKDEFQDIEAKARKAESAIAGAVGKAIRGGSWGSLNNEAVATFIETFAGVLARQTTERAGWCLQAQQPNITNQP
jgi:hypothetical protein